MTRTVDKRPRVGTDDAHGIAVFMMQRCQMMHLYGNNESLYNAAKTLTAGPGQEAKRRESHPKRIKLRKIRKLSLYSLAAYDHELRKIQKMPCEDINCEGLHAHNTSSHHARDDARDHAWDTC